MLLFTARADREEDGRADIMVKEKKKKKSRVFWVAQRTSWTV